MSQKPVARGFTAVMNRRMEPMEGEVRPVPSWPGYFATDKGIIIGRRGKPLSAFQRDDGYLQVKLSNGGLRRSASVHRLICEAFHGPPPDGHEVAHNNGVRSDNRPQNLRWATREDNRADITAHGNLLFGERHPRARLTQKQVDEIRRRYAAARGRKYVKRGVRTQLVEEFGVPLHVIKDIITGRTWASGSAS